MVYYDGMRNTIGVSSFLMIYKDYSNLEFVGRNNEGCRLFEHGCLRIY
jgi:hypothetical protein